MIIIIRFVRVEHPILFIYRNRKSVIIGRNQVGICGLCEGIVEPNQLKRLAQNPWQEANLEELAREGILLVRRRSGGGTVYHISPRLIFSILMQDEGNTNYSVMLPRDQFERRVNARLVADAVQEMGIHAVNVTDRYDVCVGDRKVSGSAFRITSKRAYHHGTMLISSNLAQLKGALRPTPNMASRPIRPLSSHQSRPFGHQSHQSSPLPPPLLPCIHPPLLPLAGLCSPPTDYRRIRTGNKRVCASGVRGTEGTHAMLITLIHGTGFMAKRRSSPESFSSRRATLTIPSFLCR
ncbi:uncharacterized protein VP01_711g6 [Puccinia sorghi]|uniref:Putative lipoate-protein ligase A n=1 Tax=Puccinia sorghi TaxID=27349 RepID=A0A0L6UFN2_9BASI|nr:uncharacterized protein VP01_711g6 [Puccinia sorghi]